MELKINEGFCIFGLKIGQIAFGLLRWPWAFGSVYERLFCCFKKWHSGRECMMIQIRFLWFTLVVFGSH